MSYFGDATEVRAVNTAGTVRPSMTVFNAVHETTMEQAKNTGESSKLVQSAKELAASHSLLGATGKLEAALKLDKEALPKMSNKIYGDYLVFEDCFNLSELYKLQHKDKESAEMNKQMNDHLSAAQKAQEDLKK